MSIVGMLIFHRQNAYWEVLLGEEQPALETMIEDMTTFIMSGLQCKDK